MHVAFGKSQDTVPSFVSAGRSLAWLGEGCQLVSIDGSHAFKDVLEDLRNFKHVADQENHFIIADDPRCTSWFCEPPTRAWITAIDEGLIRELACWKAGTPGAPQNWQDAGHYHGQYRGWCVAEYVYGDTAVLQ